MPGPEDCTQKMPPVSAVMAAHDEYIKKIAEESGFSGPSIRDVADKLDRIEKRLDAIEQKLPETLRLINGVWR